MVSLGAGTDSFFIYKMFRLGYYWVTFSAQRKRERLDSFLTQITITLRTRMREREREERGKREGERERGQ